MFEVEWEFDDKTVKNIHQAWNAFFQGRGGGTFSAGLQNGDIEAHITNRQKHVVVAEFGSGIYGEGPGSRKPITPNGAKALLIPVSTKYAKKLHPVTLQEAVENAKKHPDILSKVKSQMPGVVGFLFRTSIKGMRPIRMVRDSIPKAERVVNNEIMKLMQTGNPTRQGFAAAVNTAAAVWLREIVKNTPVLTSNLKTGWTISRFAK